MFSILRPTITRTESARALRSMSREILRHHPLDLSLGKPGELHHRDGVNKELQATTQF